MGIVSGGGGGGGASLPAHWSPAPATTDTLRSTDDFVFINDLADFLPSVTLLGSASQLFAVVSNDNNTMLQVTPSSFNVTVGDGTNPGGLVITRNSDQGTTPMLNVGGGNFNVFRRGQVKITPGGDGDVFPNLQLDGRGGTQPVLLCTGANVAPDDATIPASGFALWLDDTVGATKLMVKAKDSGGTVRTAAIALT